MDKTTILRLINKTYKTRNVYFTTNGLKRDRKDLIQHKREYLRDLISQVREKAQ